MHFQSMYVHTVSIWGDGVQDEMGLSINRLGVYIVNNPSNHAQTFGDDNPHITTNHVHASPPKPGCAT
jgi:hypothetical protein